MVLKTFKLLLCSIALAALTSPAFAVVPHLIQSDVTAATFTMTQGTNPANKLINISQTGAAGATNVVRYKANEWPLMAWMDFSGNAWSTGIPDNFTLRIWASSLAASATPLSGGITIDAYDASNKVIDSIFIPVSLLINLPAPVIKSIGNDNLYLNKYFISGESFAYSGYSDTKTPGADYKVTISGGVNNLVNEVLPDSTANPAEPHMYFWEPKKISVGFEGGTVNGKELPSGVYSVVARTPFGNSSASMIYIYPIVYGVGKNVANSTVEVSGASFGSKKDVVTVYIDNVAIDAANIISVSNKKLIVKIPTGTSVGQHMLQVAVNNSALLIGYPATLEVQSPTLYAPTIESVSALVGTTIYPNWQSVKIIGDKLGTGASSSVPPTGTTIRLVGNGIDATLADADAAKNLVFYWANKEVQFGTSPEVQGTALPAGTNYKVVITNQYGTATSPAFSINPYVAGGATLTGDWKIYTTQTMEVSGSGFVSGTKIYLDGTELTGVTFVNNRTLRVIIPAGFATGSHVLSVVANTLTSNVDKTVSIFSIGDLAPTIQSVAPVAGSIVYPNWQAIKIVGDRFVDGSGAFAPSGTTLKLVGNGINLALSNADAAKNLVYYWGNKEVQFGISPEVQGTAIPAGTNYKVSITNQYGTATSAAFSVYPYVEGGATLTGDWKIMAGQTIEVAGYGFATGSKLYLGATEITGVTVVNNRTLRAVVPTGFTGANTSAQYALKVVTNTLTSNLDKTVTVFAANAFSPKITALSPKSAHVYDTLTVTGEYLSTTTVKTVALTFANAQSYAPIIYGQSATQMKPYISAEAGSAVAVAGAANISISDGKFTTTEAFTLLPTLYEGSGVSGEVVAVGGEALGTDKTKVSVVIGGKTAVISSVTNKAVTLKVPALNPGDYNVTVTVNSASTTYSNAFTVNAAQATAVNITKVTPNDFAKVWQNITIEGTNFTFNPTTKKLPPTGGAVELSFFKGAKYSAPVYWWQNDKIEVGLTAEADGVMPVAGPVGVKVTLNGQADIIDPAFTLKPTVSETDLGSAPKNQLITLNGYAFGTATNDVFVQLEKDGVVAANVNAAVAKNTQIKFYVPVVEAGNYQLNVFVNAIAADQHPKISVEVNTVPTQGADSLQVSSMTPDPTKEQLIAGQTIIIEGTKFGASGSVTFSGPNGTSLQANTVVWQDKKIVLAVPAKAVDGNLTLVNASSESLVYSYTLGKGIVLDDFEGGCTEYAGGNPNYFNFETTSSAPTIVRTNFAGNIPEDGGAYAMSVNYSFQNKTQDWGGGWGAQLSQAIDLTGQKYIMFYLKGDGTTNEALLQIVDVDGDVWQGKPVKLSNSEYNLIVQKISDFVIDPRTVVAGNGKFDSINKYQVIYLKSNGSINVTTAKHYIDSLKVSKDSIVSDVNPQITEINPTATYAGQVITISGANFGDTKGYSKVVFGTTYAGNIQKWTSTEIVVIVPEELNPGDYEVKIINNTNPLNSLSSNTLGLSILSPLSAGSMNVYPNPFNPAALQSVKFEFNPGAATQVKLYVFDISGRLLHAEAAPASGTLMTMTWNGKDDWNQVCGDGVYLVRIADPSGKVIGKAKVLLIKGK